MNSGEDVKEEKRRAAIIIGITRYKNSKLNLKGAKNDADELYNRLTNSEVYKYNIPKHHFLRDDEATADNIRVAINDVLYKADKYELVLFYFSGHGLRDNYGNGWLLAHDTEPSDVYARGINMADIQRVVSQCKNKGNVLVMLDCCYSGIATEGSKDALMESDPDGIEKINEQLKTWATGENKIIIASSKGTQQSKEEELTHITGDKHYHGLFSYFLIEGLDNESLTGPTWHISLKNLMNYVYKEIKEKKGEDQVPVCYCSGVSLSEFTSFPEIKIAVSNKYISKRIDIVKLAKETLNNQTAKTDFEELCGIAGDVQRILEYQPEYKDAVEVKRIINEDAVVQCRGIMMRWINLNKDIIKRDPQQRSLAEFNEGNEKSLLQYLTMTLPSLSFDKLIGLNKFERDVLSSLCERAFAKTDFTEDQDGVKIFMEWVKTSYQTRYPKNQESIIDKLHVKKEV